MRQGRAPFKAQWLGWPVRATPRFRTAHPGYQRLNRLQCYSTGEADPSQQEIRYDVYGLN